MIYLHFLIAHFIGDYWLQNTRIVDWKHRSVVGVLFHASLVLLAFVVVLWPYLHDSRVVTAILVNYVVHAVQDQLKVMVEHYWEKPFTPYALDQVLHWTLALALAWWVSDVSPQFPDNGLGQGLAALYTSPLVMGYLLGLILLTYAWDITRYIWRISRGRYFDYQRDFRGMVTRVGILTAVFALLGLFKR